MFWITTCVTTSVKYFGNTESYNGISDLHDGEETVQ
jgi:hypothetical protein